MLISNSATARALDEVVLRQREAVRAFTPQTGSAFDPLCASPPEDAYFIARGKHGELLFSKQPSFQFRDGVLVDSGGMPVQGYRDSGGVLGALRIDPIDNALAVAQSARMGSDGTMSYERMTIDPRSGNRETQRVAIGRVALARFAPATRLLDIDLQHLVAGAGVTPHIGIPSDGSFDSLKPFSPQAAGIDAGAGLQRLQEAYLALDALRAADSAQRSVDKTAMDLLK